MAQLHRGVRSLVGLTVRELASLHILNEELRQTEHWICEHAVRSQLACKVTTATASDMPKMPARDSQRDVEMAASILCMRQATTSDCGALNDNVVASLSVANVLEQDGRHGYEQAMATDEDALLGLNPCGLFSMLLNQMNGDWLRMLDVRAVKVEMTVTATWNQEVSHPLAWKYHRSRV